MRTVAAQSPETDFVSAPGPAERTSYLDGFDLYVMPMLDGILGHEASAIAEAVALALGLDESERTRLSRRLADLAI